MSSAIAEAIAIHPECVVGMKAAVIFSSDEHLTQNGTGGIFALLAPGRNGMFDTKVFFENK